MQVGQYGRTLAGAPCRVEGELNGFPLVRLWNPFSEKMTTIMVAEVVPDSSARQSLELREAALTASERIRAARAAR